MQAARWAWLQQHPGRLTGMAGGSDRCVTRGAKGQEEVETAQKEVSENLCFVHRQD